MKHTIMSVKDLSFSYTDKPFISGISLDIDEGELISVIGENGSGKSTLLRLLCGSFKARSGEVSYKGKNIYKMPPLERAKEVAVIYQNSDYKFPFSCYETVSMGLYPHKNRFSALKEDDESFILDIMRKTDTLKLADKPITELSGGEIQRTFLARALVQKPKLLFMDEATSGLDISARIKMTKLLREYIRRRKMTVVSVQHDISLAFSYSDKIIALKNGAIAARGRPEELLNEAFFRDIFNVKAEISEDRFYITDTI